ncbi:MAG: hypothetical protein HN736_13440 [Anaerolineae bacterium]|jgi:hypothetical protein|nr:hypothetical protein [Anaerolineae bacterium]MBT4312239.1 hypothetical protein [Anaerolineae bacterium]MBT4458346.1 hypothetical protein [Anaerolineae bacterium]MBT4842805.1 hypothetical protein [Anaerolineae bacterium]MBT6059757.1 hypothetical protein [Anaerolineae bacterium]
MSFLIKFLKKLFGIGKSTPDSHPNPKPATPVDNPNEPALITVNRVLLIIYNPTMDAATGEKLADQSGWQRPDDLVTGFSADVLQTSHGMARYEIVERIEVDEFPILEDGFRYSSSLYLDVLHGVSPHHQPHGVDYHAILREFNIAERISNNEIDEVWVFGFPYAGFHESVMAGKNAFWCNAAPLAQTSHIARRFVIMGFSYERGVGEMLESFGHRLESVMEKTFAKKRGETNLWERYTRYDKKNPGQAEVGNIHFAPNSERDYDWGNPRLVPSKCDDWLNFPYFRGATRQVNADEWGNGDIRLHHQWWQKRIPHVAGRLNGIHNNWWQYIMNVNNVEF